MVRYLTILFIAISNIAFAQSRESEKNVYNDSVYTTILEKHIEYLKGLNYLKDTLFLSEESLNFYTPPASLMGVKIYVPTLKNISDLTKEKGIHIVFIKKIKIERKGFAVWISDFSVRYSKRNYNYILQSSTVYHWTLGDGSLLWQLVNIEHLSY